MTSRNPDQNAGGSPQIRASVQIYTGGRLTGAGFEPTPPGRERRPQPWLPIAAALVVVAAGVGIAMPFVSRAASAAPTPSPAASSSLSPGPTPPAASPTPTRPPLTGQPSAGPTAIHRATTWDATPSWPVPTGTTPTRFQLTELARCLYTLIPDDVAPDDYATAGVGIAGYQLWGLGYSSKSGAPVTMGSSGTTTVVAPLEVTDVTTGETALITSSATAQTLLRSITNYPRGRVVDAAAIARYANDVRLSFAVSGQNVTVEGIGSLKITLTPKKRNAVAGVVVQLPRFTATASIGCGATTRIVEIAGFTTSRASGSTVVGVECGKPTDGMSADLAAFAKVCASLA